MSVPDFLRRQWREQPPSRQPPTHLPDQRDLLREFFEPDGERWLFFFDGGRYDFFDTLYPKYVEGDLRRCWNGGVAYTGDWATRNLCFDVGNRGLFSWLPLRELQHSDFDGREHFAVAPDVRPEAGVRERLVALGYADGEVSPGVEANPKHVDRSVREHATDLNGGVIRYVKPHPPLEGMEALTTGSGKATKVAEALKRGEIDYLDLTLAYQDTYEVAFEHAVGLIPDLDGKVVITADHGTCLHCGQFFHGRNFDLHDHLAVVPWFEVSKIV